MNIRREIFALIESLNCTYERGEEDGIVRVQTKEGYVWEFTVPLREDEKLIGKKIYREVKLSEY